MQRKKVFISYSWSNANHEDWVEKFAQDLVAANVDVLLDKWALLPGHDANAFMEKMVGDPSVDKVVMVCDPVYVAKADGRSGGVGTETQIISKSVYQHQSQDKFVAVVREKGDDGVSCVPIYYGTKIWIDLSDDFAYSENLEKVIRWIYGKPLKKKPEFGKTPSYILEEEKVRLATSVAYGRCLDAIKADKSYAFGAFDEYFSVLKNEIGRLKFKEGEECGDDKIIQIIEDFLEYRNEAITVFICVAQYTRSDQYAVKIHRFFESLIPYMYRPIAPGAFKMSDHDHFRFIAHELFLYALAVFIRYERFDCAKALLSVPYYVKEQLSDFEKNVFSFSIFSSEIRSFEVRNSRLKLQRASLWADQLKERAQGTGIDFNDLMQADFVAFVRDEVTRGEVRWKWWPESLIYAAGQRRPFEIFGRSVSEKYLLNNVLPLLGVTSKAELEGVCAEFRSHSRRPPQWVYHTISPSVLAGIEDIGSKP